MRLQVGRGANVIKIATTGGVNSRIGAGLGAQMFEDEARALTADGALVLMRDDDLDRTTDATDTPAAVRQGSPEAVARASACLAG